MRTRIAIAAVLAVVAFSASCGKDDPPTPTQPTPVTPPVAPPTTPVVTLTDLALKGPSWFVDDPVLEVGATVELTLDAEYSDGTTDDVTADASWE